MIALDFLRVVRAARVWRTCRHGRVGGEVYHRSCRALDEAVAAFNGELDRAPIDPPTPDEIAASQAMTAKLRARALAGCICRYPEVNLACPVHGVSAPDDDRTLLAEARARGGRCPHRVVAYADGRTARCRKAAAHEGECE